MTRNWFDGVLILFFVLGPVLIISAIGNERKPLTKTDAIVSLVINALLIAGIISYGR